MGASLSVTDSDVSSNQAVTTVGFDNLGGGIYNLGGKATISECTLANNQVSGGGRSSFVGGSSRGALENGVGAILTVTDSSFTHNQAISAPGSGFFGAGGALDNEVGSTATISNCQFAENQAIGSTAIGGAVGNFQGPATITNSTFS